MTYQDVLSIDDLLATLAETIRYDHKLTKFYLRLWLIHFEDIVIVIVGSVQLQWEPSY